MPQKFRSIVASPEDAEKNHKEILRKFIENVPRFDYLNGTISGPALGTHEIWLHMGHALLIKPEDRERGAKAEDLDEIKMILTPKYPDGKASLVIATHEGYSFTGAI